jgi:hypothetical protein
MLPQIETNQAEDVSLQPVNMQHWSGPGTTSILGAPPVPGGSGPPLTSIGFTAVSLILLGCFVGRIARRRAKGDVPLCPHCDFDLRGSEVLPAHCIECGQPIDIRLVARRRTKARRGMRRSIRLLGRGCIVTGLAGLLLLVMLSPIRIDLSPNWWLLNVDALMIPASTWTRDLPGDRRSNGDFWGLRSRWMMEVERRGRAGSISDKELGDLTWRLLEWDASGSQLSRFEWSIVRTACLSGSIPFDQLASLPSMRPVTPGQAVDDTRRSLAGRPGDDRPQAVLDQIRLRQFIRPGDACMTLHAGEEPPLSLEFTVLSVTVGDVTFPVEHARTKLPWPPITNDRDSVIDFNVMPPKDVMLPAGRQELRWELRTRGFWKAAPDEPRLLYSSISTETSPEGILVAHDPDACNSAEPCASLREHFLKFGAVETNLEGASARLVVDLGSMHRAEIGPATIMLTLPGNSPDDLHPRRFSFPMETVIDRRPGDRNCSLLDDSWSDAYVRLLSTTLPNVLAVGTHVKIEFDSMSFTEAEHRELYRSIARDDDELARLLDRIPAILACRFEVELPVVPWGSRSVR